MAIVQKNISFLTPEEKLLDDLNKLTKALEEHSLLMVKAVEMGAKMYVDALDKPRAK